MATEEDIHVGDIGTVFRMTLYRAVNTVFSIATATVLQFVFLSPKKRRFVVTAVPTTDGTDGKLEYVSQDGDLDVAGGWKYQAKVTNPQGSWSGEIISFTVKANL